MSQEDTITVDKLDAVLEAAALLRPEWPAITARIPSWHPRCEGDGEGDGEGEGDGGEGEGGEGGGDQMVPMSEVRKLRREAAKYRTEAQAANTKVKEFEDASKTEKERADEARAAAEQRASSAETKLLRFEVAADKGVPAKLAKFLTGSTKEELETAADELLAELGSNGRSSFDGGARDDAPKGDMDAAIRRAAGRG